MGVPIFLFYGDKRKTWPDFIAKALPYYDAFLINSYDAEEQEFLNREYKPQRIFYHHTATDLEVFKKDSKIDENVDVIFFGSNYNELFPESTLRRDWILRLITESDITVRLYGHGWEGKARSVVFSEDYAREASTARMLLGFNAFNDINFYTSNRAFNSMACGTFLSTKWKGCESMFEDKKELFYFETYEEMVGLIRTLKDDPNMRREVHEAGRKLLALHHTYRVRAGELSHILNHINEENGYGQANSTV